jgi:hypothetical protein
MSKKKVTTRFTEHADAHTHVRRLAQELSAIVDSFVFAAPEMHGFWIKEIVRVKDELLEATR